MRLMGRRVILACAALFLAASCTGGGSTTSSTAPTTPTNSVSSDWPKYIDRAAGFSMRYPPGWNLEHFEGVCTIGGTGAMVSNVPGMYHDPESPNGCSFPPSMDSLPPNGVVVMGSTYFGGPYLPGSVLYKNTPLPLTVDMLSEPRGLRRSASVVFHHNNRYEVSVWMGDGVSAADRSAAADVLGSIEPWHPSEPALSYGSCVGGWERQDPGSVGDLGSSLNGIDLASSSDGWAVGSYIRRIPGESSGSNGWPKGVIPAVSAVMIEHWDGQAWDVVEAPDPNLQARPFVGSGSTLRDVAAIFPNDAWAVGGGGNYGLTEHWNGQAWSVVPSPKVDLVDTTLVGVAAAGPNDAWAVGSGGRRGKIGPIIEHWDGTRWVVSPVPNVGNRYSSADDVSASGPDDAWVVGQSWDKALSLHWDGVAWWSVPSPAIRSPRLTGVADLAPDDAWAVGATYANVNGAGPSHALVEHWDGARWTVASLPHLSNDTTLTDIAASGDGDVWAMGWANEPSGKEIQIVLHFDGSRWSSMDPPIAGPSQGWYVGLAATPGVAWTGGRVSPGSTWGTEVAYLARSC